MTRYDALIERLSRKSVEKHFDAYEDVDWDAHTIDPTDPAWALSESDPLGGTEWYRALPADRQATLGLDLVVSQLKLGIEFENVLSRGLLAFAADQPNGSVNFRYALHEVIEEGQHSLMFQEFINRSGRDPYGLDPVDRFASRRVVHLGRVFPELFFLFVLGGEAPIDHVQREALRGDDVHPLLRQIMRIHVIEEARHLCFAKAWLRQRVPQLSTFRRLRIALHAPIVLGEMARQMLRPTRQMVARHGIPRAVVREAARRGRPGMVEAVRPVRELCAELGLVPRVMRPLWRPLAPALEGPA